MSETHTQPKPEQQLKVQLPQEMQPGVYANNMIVSHTKEEFILDFMILAPPTATVTSRVIVSPAHMKRILTALQENMAKYEKSYGKISESSAPHAVVGFVPWSQK
jgi:hypothetical protein